MNNYMNMNMNMNMNNNISNMNYNKMNMNYGNMLSNQGNFNAKTDTLIMTANRANLLNGNNMNNNREIQHQLKIYNKIKNRTFSQPNYNNYVNINNIKISANNKNSAELISKKARISFITPLEIIYKEQYGIYTNTTKEREKCPICMIEFYDDIIDNNTQNFNLKDFNTYINHEIDTVKLYKCEDHFYHIECLLNLINQSKDGFKCALCQKIYGTIKGEMPDGKMEVRIDKKNKCKGYEHDETIIITYSFKDGTKNGKHYYGTSRVSYLPNNKEGREILGMLKIAFDRKLTFTIGTSVTTGQKNAVIWNGIHHKTNLNGGVHNYGYPDPTYFSRVTEELAAKGINKKEFGRGELEGIAINLLYNR